MRILIAEDEPVTALALAERVRSLGHDALGPVPDGVQAVAAGRAETPDLYLFDVEMPRLDGLGAAARLADGGLRRPVVVVTGVDDPGLIERSAVIGVVGYLVKPVGTRQLQAAITLAAARHADLLTLEAELDLTRRALEERKLVERAKGLLMAALKISEEDAFRRLQKTARDRNLRLTDVAERIVEQRALLERAAQTTKPSSSRDARSSLTSR
jgi:two-component system, response regulator PdtaR